MEVTQFLAAGVFVDSNAPQVIAFGKGSRRKGKPNTQARRILRLYYNHSRRHHLRSLRQFRRSGELSGELVSSPLGAASALARRHCWPRARARSAFRRASGTLTCETISPRRGFTERSKPRTFFGIHTQSSILSGRWVKATPAFDKALCDRIGLEPLQFDGETYSLFQQFDQAGLWHMEYLNDRFRFADEPFNTIRADFDRGLI